MIESPMIATVGVMFRRGVGVDTGACDGRGGFVCVVALNGGVVGFCNGSFLGHFQVLDKVAGVGFLNE